MWPLFFLICFGLGYAALNRYDPRQKLPDAAVYAQIATNGPRAAPNHLRFRILVPSLAREVYAIANGHTGSWDPLMFSFLVVNASFVASTAYLLLRVGTAIINRPVALLASAFYLLNFAIANVHLAGLVDAAEAFFLMALVVSLFYEKWWLLPVICVFGTLAKESFVPFSIATALSWILASERKSRRGWSWIVVTAAVELLTLIALQAAIAGHVIWPWQFLSSMGSETSYGMNLLHSLVDRNSWYILIWLVPLGLAGMRALPRPWIWSAGAAVLIALLLNAYHSTVGGGGGGIGRYVFDVAGPLLSLSAAAYLSGASEKQSTSAG